MAEEKRMSVNEWLKAYDKGEFDAVGFNPNYYHIACKAGWYDWFCSEKHLVSALKTFAPKIKALSTSAKINADTMYVWFKNNCPCSGPLYDDFRFADIETHEVQYTIAHEKKGCYGKNGGWSVWGIDNDFDAPIIEGASWKEVREFFGV